MREKTKKQAVNKVVSILDTVLKVEANSASCIITYEPKAPKELKRFKKQNDCKME